MNDILRQIADAAGADWYVVEATPLRVRLVSRIITSVTVDVEIQRQDRQSVLLDIIRALPNLRSGEEDV